MEIHTAKVETWDKVSETYLDEISDSEKEMGEILFKVFKKLCKQNEEISVVELGSGSGHLSAVIAKLGAKTTLVDFSSKALEVSQKLYSMQNIKGQFVCQDLFDLNLEQEYDIAWNSGVLEHFNDIELDELIKKLCFLNVKYFVFVVPNAISMPYLLYRHYLESKNEWIWGKEFLRTDYVKRFLKAGFKKINTFYLGKKYTQYLLNVPLKRQFPYLEFVDTGVIPEENNALVGYIFEQDSNLEENIDKNNEEMDSVTSLKTRLFELQGKLEYATDIVYAQNLKNKENEECIQKVKEKESILEDEKQELEKKNNLLQQKNVELEKKIMELEQKLTKKKVLDLFK